MTDIIDPAVRAGWRAWNKPFEGEVAHLYCDSKGLVTIAVGDLVDPIAAALSLPLRHPSGELADRDAIVTDWWRVKDLGRTATTPRGWVYTYYRSPVGLHLDDADIEALVLARLDANAVILAQEYADFASFPAPAQSGILSMAWAMGAGFPHTWPRFSASVKARDWRGCAANCAINAVGNPGVIPRNAAQRAAFLEAATIEGGAVG